MTNPGYQPGLTATISNDPTEIMQNGSLPVGRESVTMDAASVDSKLTMAALSNVTGITVDYISNGNTRTGNATITFTDTGNLLKYSEPGGSLGTGVDVDTAGSYKIIDGTDSTAYIIVTSEGSAGVPTADKSDTLAITAEGTPVTTLRKGMIVSRVTSGGKWKQYDNGNSDGTEVARGILLDAVNMLNHIGTAIDTPAVIGFSGFFKESKLFGLDAAAKVDLTLVKFDTDF